jgi:hypothetical protein
MIEDFHVIASACETRFTTKGEAGPMVFSSLVDAARHARRSSGGKDGFLVISNEYGKAMSRIPFNVIG